MIATIDFYILLMFFYFKSDYTIGNLCKLQQNWKNEKLNRMEEPGRNRETGSE